MSVHGGGMRETYRENGEPATCDVPERQRRKTLREKQDMQTASGGMQGGMEWGGGGGGGRV